MAITLSALQLIASLYTRGILSNRQRVIEIGSQDLHPKQDDIANLLSRLVGYRRNPDTIITPEVMYQSLGFTTYRCIDADGRHCALKFDLNNDIAQTYQFSETFDLVTNHGTTEHILDQRRAFSNIHNLCSKNGIILHEVPFQRWLNHGLYNYQPAFFYDLAHANHYDINSMHIGLPAIGDIMPYSDHLARTLTKTDMDLELLVVLKKTREEPFHNAYNGKYLESSLLRDEYRAQYEFGHLDEQFFPGVRTTRADSTTDMNLATTKTIVRTLLRRLAAKFVGA